MTADYIMRVLDEVIEAFGVPASELLGRSTNPRAARARHAWWYLLNTAGNVSGSAVARIVGRSRTSVERGIGLAEDRRDDPGFDEIMTRLETRVQAQ